MANSISFYHNPCKERQQKTMQPFYLIVVGILVTGQNTGKPSPINWTSATHAQQTVAEALASSNIFLNPVQFIGVESGQRVVMEVNYLPQK